MNILFLSYYADFDRFFDAVSRAIKAKSPNSFTHELCIHPSGYIRAAKHIDRKVFLPFAVRFQANQDYKLSGEEYRYILEYPTALGGGISTELVRKYCGYFSEYIGVNGIDCVVISGDTRFQSRALKLVCERLGLRHYFFEQGPFSTTTFDTEGTNCNASFAHSLEANIGASNLRGAVGGGPAFSTFGLRVFDHLIGFLSRFMRVNELAEEKSLIQLLRRFSPARLTGSEGGSAEQKAIVLLGQVPTDANTLLFCQVSWFDVIRCLKERYPKLPIVFREHPLYRGSLGGRLYDFFESNQVMLSGASLSRDLQRAKFVVCANSQAGLEAILQYQLPVLLTGRAIYGCLNGAFKFDRNFDEIVEYRIGKKAHQKNLQWFASNFYAGHFRDVDLSEISESLTNRLLNDH